MMELLAALTTIDPLHQALLASLALVTAYAIALRAVARLVDSVHETVYNIRKRDRYPPRGGGDPKALASHPRWS